jgi:signal transduction histidine kinase/CheY-like chemotaxis protein
MSDPHSPIPSEDSRSPLIAAHGLSDLLATIPDLAFVCDAEGRVLWGNSTCESLIGRPLSAALGRSLLAQLPLPARRRALRALAYQRRHQAVSFEVTLPLPDPRGRVTEVTARVLRRERPDGGVVFAGAVRPADAVVGPRPAEPSAVVVGRREEIAPRGAGAGHEEAESEILQASDVLAAMSQELRKPMNAMIGMARLLLQTRLDEEQKALVDLIWKSGQATLRLVNDACVFTRADAGQLELDHIAFDLRVTVDETASTLAALAAETGHRLECRVHPAVPSRLRGDPGRLRQVLLNLGERAIRSFASGRVEMLVSRLRESDQGVTLRFLVMGRLVAAESTARDEQGPRAASGPGVGWGPAVIRRLADFMGGRTGTECTEVGTCRHWFDVDLEKREDRECEAAPSLSRAELATRRSLVVDASPVVARTLRGRMESVGCRVATAGGADEAHAALRAAVEAGDPFHFVLIDRDLPGLDGEELGAMIRADHALDVARTIMLTSVGRRGDATRARACGFSAFLPKDVGAEELVEALCEVVHQALVTPQGGAPELVTRYSLAEARRSKTRVLLVDEDVVSQVVTQWYLRRLGYRLEIASTIGEARAVCSDAAFDIVMVDEQLADGDALTFARELCERDGGDRRVSVIAMFKQAGSPAHVAWQESGVGDQVIKPVDLVVLARLVERLTGTGLHSGSAIEDEYAGMPEVGQNPVAGDRLEIVTPDVDRILTDSEARSAEAVALALAMGDSAPDGADADEPGAVVVDPSAPGGPDPHEMRFVDTLLPADVEPLDEVTPESPAAETLESPAAEAPESPAAEAPESPATEPPVAASGDEDGATAPPVPEAAPLQIVGASEPPAAPPREPVVPFDSERLESASTGLPAARSALLGEFLNEINPFLEKLAWMLSDDDARDAASKAQGLAALARSVGATACAAALEELAQRGAEGALRASDPILQRCYGQGLDAATEVRVLLGQQRRAA